jgi:hypothetical protein
MTDKDNVAVPTDEMFLRCPVELRCSVPGCSEIMPGDVSVRVTEPQPGLYVLAAGVKIARGWAAGHTLRRGLVVLFCHHHMTEPQEAPKA